MHLRADAAAAAAEIVLLVESLAQQAAAGGTRATVGRIDVSPGSMTTIAGAADIWVDVRGLDLDQQRQVATAIVDGAAAACAWRGVGCRATPLAETPPVPLPAGVRNTLVATCQDLGLEPVVLSSGASHDAQQVNRVTPTGMIFIPSRGGISHDPSESTDIDDVATGATVLAASLLRSLSTFTPGEQMVVVARSAGGSSCSRTPGGFC